MALGLFQFSPRSSGSAILPCNRWLGRVYLAVGVLLIGGLSGLYMAQFAYALAAGGICHPRRALAVYRPCVRNGHSQRQCRRAQKVDVQEFALTFAAVMLRVYLPLSMAARLDFASSPGAWYCWVPNLLFAEWWLRRRERVRTR